ncbi:molybdate ABC transporter permease subunit [Vibrio ostreicida]|uniref:Molybdenum transport system permease n=1 Tax=Vibrio ostreicida TaxID=526588 RepID=A0ABT8BXD7_9VIBR|nr:molybdate ABC transporter permease subunit [Vibrio ostreicida]MDN3611673.1 molybdate ABC transporter permease subunit [Vibrio ostreicida]NPD10128.1 molybdate ABC transporter permease subunit [Vibrio ostreicida]
MFAALSEYEYQALMLSLKVAVYATGWLIPIGIGLGWVLAKKQFVGKTWLDSLVHLPLVLPPVVIGYLLLISVGRQSYIGHWLYEYFGLVFSFSWKGAVLACLVVSLPLMVRAIRLSVENVDARLEQAAATLGASPTRVFCTITLPLIFPGVISGALLSFARSLGEFGATISFVSNIPGETQTIPLAMYTFIETPGAETETLRLCVLSVLIALCALLLSDRASRRLTKRLGTHG